MPTITIGSGYTPPENYFSQPDGTYPVTLVQIGVTADDDTFTPFGTRSYESQFGTRIVQDWTFALENGEIIETGVTAPKEKDGGLRIHPKSTYFAYVTALAGGKSLAEGTEFDPQKHLVGRMALATIARDEQGFPRITNLGAMPTAMAQPQQQSAPAPAAAQPAAAPAPVAAPVDAASAQAPDGSLPF